MRVSSNNIEVVFGKGIGHVIEDLLMNAKQRIWIMSPWISEHYTEFLTKKKNEGVEVVVFTSNHTGIKSHKRALKKMLKFKEEWNKRTIAILGAYTSIIAALALLFHPSVLVFLLLGLGLKNRLKRINVNREIDVHIYDNITSLTHAKLYIIDDVAIISSANFTDYGMYRNLEAATIIRDEEVVRNLENYLRNLDSNPNLRKVDVSALRL